MDLSKAGVCIPYDLLVATLHSYVLGILTLLILKAKEAVSKNQQF